MRSELPFVKFSFFLNFLRCEKVFLSIYFLRKQVFLFENIKFKIFFNKFNNNKTKYLYFYIKYCVLYQFWAKVAKKPQPWVPLSGVPFKHFFQKKKIFYKDLNYLATLLTLDGQQCLQNHTNSRRSLLNSMLAYQTRGLDSNLSSL